jgi:hypothetical protein
MARTQIFMADMLEISIHRLPLEVSGRAPESFSEICKLFLGGAWRVGEERGAELARRWRECCSAFGL